MGYQSSILPILQIILGVLLIFFIPGFIIMRNFYKNIHGVERAALIVTISIAVSIIIGLILGLLHIFNFISSIISYAIVIIGIYAYKLLHNHLRDRSHAGS